MLLLLLLNVVLTNGSAYCCMEERGDGWFVGVAQHRYMEGRGTGDWLGPGRVRVRRERETVETARRDSFFAEVKVGIHRMFMTLFF